MPIHKTEAIVLRRMDFRETSLIVNFYTRDFGKMSGILKGIRADPRKFSSTLEPFSHNTIVFYRNRSSGLHLVSQCDIKNHFMLTRKDIARIGAANIIIELLNAIMPDEDKNEEIFDLALSSLNQLTESNLPDKIARIFKIKVLALSGFKPHFDSCICCNAQITGDSKFSLGLGGLLCIRCYKRDQGARDIFKGTVSSILYIQRNNFRCNLNLGMNYQIQHELDMVLNSFLNFHLEKELKSHKVVKAMAAEANTKSSMEGKAACPPSLALPTRGREMEFTTREAGL